jgi:hypothetical protein
MHVLDSPHRRGCHPVPARPYSDEAYEPRKRTGNRKSIVVGHVQLDVSGSFLREPRREAVSGQRHGLHADSEQTTYRGGLVSLAGVDPNGGFQQSLAPRFERQRDAVATRPRLENTG